MRYLTDDWFIAETDKPFKMVVDVGADPVDSTTSLLLLTVIDSFQPNPQTGQILKMDEIRRMNEAAKFFENQHGEGHGEPGDVYAFEDSHWAVLKKLVEWRMPIMGQGWTRSAPAMLDLLEAMPKEDPRLDKEKSDNDDPGNGVVTDISSAVKDTAPVD